MKPSVSAVIPTRNRPNSVLRAVESALSQTVSDIEVIVIIDGPDKTTADVLSSITDSRLRVLELGENVGGSEARNIGVRSASGEWIAFLDDDDEWLLEKTEKQLELASDSDYPFPIIASRFVGHTSSGDVVWPIRLPRDGEHLSEYMFCRNSMRPREGQIITSVLMAKRDLLLRVPFTVGLKKRQESDWCLRVLPLAGVGVEFHHLPLAVLNFNDSIVRVSRVQNWKESLEWLKSVRIFITPRAYAGCIATQIVHEAAEQKIWSAFLVLLGEMFRNGSPGVFDVLTYFANWLATPGLRRAIRHWLSPKPGLVADTGVVDYRSNSVGAGQGE